MDVKYVLCVSGGGVKDLIPATILDLLHDELKIDISFFDLVVATSGGAMLCMYGSHMISSDKPFKYEDLFSSDNMETICDKGVWDQLMGEVQFCPVYDGMGKKLILKKYFGDLKLRDIDIRVAVPIYNLYKKQTELFSSYNAGCEDFQVAEVCDGASAAIPYFPSVKIGNDMYIDGGVSANDPLLLAFTEARKLFGKNHPIRLLSLGTGRQIPTEIWKNNPIEKWGCVQWIRHGLIDLLMSAPLDLMVDNVDSLMQSECKLNRLLYINDNIPPDIKLDDTNENVLKELKNIGKKSFENNRVNFEAFFDSKSCRCWNNVRKLHAEK